MDNPFSNIERLAIHTTDGLGLRAEYLGVEPERPVRALAVICHPHPLHGGNMYNHVVGGLFAGLPPLGVAVLRFNFRGTSGSEGRHGGGGPERLDVEAAIEAVGDSRRERNGDAGANLPLLLVGYSFGALVALTVDRPAVGGWLAIAPPLTLIGDNVPVAAADARPTVMVAGTTDDFCSAATAEELTASWESTRVVPLVGEDHFLAGAQARLLVEAETVIDQLTPPSP